MTVRPGQRLGRMGPGCAKRARSRDDFGAGFVPVDLAISSLTAEGPVRGGHRWALPRSG